MGKFKAASTTLLLSMIHFSATAQMTITGTPPATATVGKEYYFVPVVENANQKELQFNYVNRPAWSDGYQEAARSSERPRRRASIRTFKSRRGTGSTSP